MQKVKGTKRKKIKKEKENKGKHEIYANIHTTDVENLVPPNLFRMTHYIST